MSDCRLLLVKVQCRRHVCDGNSKDFLIIKPCLVSSSDSYAEQGLGFIIKHRGRHKIGTADAEYSVISISLTGYQSIGKIIRSIRVGGAKVADNSAGVLVLGHSAIAQANICGWQIGRDFGHIGFEDKIGCDITGGNPTIAVMGHCLTSRVIGVSTKTIKGVEYEGILCAACYRSG